jgi:altronate dehydratase
MSTAGVLTGEMSIPEAGEKLVKLAVDIGSGTLAKGGTLNYTDPIEVFFDGPFL